MSEQKIDETLKLRAEKYGRFEDNARITQELYDVIKNTPNFSVLTKVHLEAYHMIFHKIARSLCGDHTFIDNIHDIIGYAKLLENFLINEEKKGLLKS